MVWPARLTDRHAAGRATTLLIDAAVASRSAVRRTLLLATLLLGMTWAFDGGAPTLARAVLLFVQVHAFAFVYCGLTLFAISASDMVRRPEAREKPLLLGGGGVCQQALEPTHRLLDLP
jgi:hypothetical protein